MRFVKHLSGQRWSFKWMLHICWPFQIPYTPSTPEETPGTGRRTDGEAKSFSQGQKNYIDTVTDLASRDWRWWWIQTLRHILASSVSRCYKSQSVDHCIKPHLWTDSPVSFYKQRHTVSSRYMSSPDYLLATIRNGVLLPAFAEIHFLDQMWVSWFDCNLLNI